MYCMCKQCKYYNKLKSGPHKADIKQHCRSRDSNQSECICADKAKFAWLFNDPLGHAAFHSVIYTYLSSLFSLSLSACVIRPL